MISMRQYEKGEPIMTEGEREEKAYVIEEGLVEVFITRNGKKINLNKLGPGETIGEMSIIDDKPRGATVVAIEHTTVREIPRDDFVESLEKVPLEVINIMRCLFERLRNSNNLIARYEEKMPLNGKSENVNEASPQEQEQVLEEGVEPIISCRIEGLTPEALNSLPESPYVVTDFPFRIGRSSSDPLTNNHLDIPDDRPYQISRHHMAIILEEGKIGIIDRGSHLGLSVDGKRVGGGAGTYGPIFFDEDQGTFSIGTLETGYQYKVSLTAPNN